MGKQNLITLENVTIGYNKAITSSINFSIDKGDFWAILGPNGGGKTTLLKTIMGLIPAIEGNINYIKKPKFGYVPQREDFDNIFPISVAELVAMGRYIRVPVGRGLGEADWDYVMQCLEKVGMTHLKDRAFRSLSGGEKQRALLARSVAGEPEILVLDEPTASVDIKAETTIMELVDKINKEDGLTVLMVSHFINTVTRYARKFIVIDKDKDIFHAGNKEKVLSRKILSSVFNIDINSDHILGNQNKNTSNRQNSA